MSIYEAEMPNIVSGSYGDVDIYYSESEKAHYMRHKGILWMSADKDCMHSRNTLYSQYDLAYGRVLLTGLGFGILAKALSEKPEVTAVTVVELNQDVIDAFLMHNTLNSKVTIVLADASTFSSDIKYDCVLPDHYETQGFDWRIKDMNSLGKRIKHDVYWPWSIEELFLYKVYPQSDYRVLSRTDNKFTKLAGKSVEIPQKWKLFIEEYFPDLPVLSQIEDEKLLAYIEKYAQYYFETTVTPWEAV
jgi:hypothetical protein